MSTPQSIISICSRVRLDPRYEHTLYFDTIQKQAAYFAGKVVKTFSAYSYLRKSWSIKVQATMYEARSWNYLFFTNGTPGKTYYYFINNIEYVNDNTVELSLELDVLQTYLFDMALLPCFVERQHTVSDSIGEHTVDEGLEVGELICAGTQNIDPGELAIMVMSTINPNATTTEAAVPALPYMYNGVFSGIKIWAVDPTKWAEWGNQLDTLDTIGQTDSIIAMWMYPKSLVNLGGGATWTTAIANPVESAKSIKNAGFGWTIAKKLSDLNGYTPRNNKLFCYPYNFAYCTNNAGNSAVYRYERFEGDNMLFTLSGSLSPDGGVHMTPRDYNGIATNYHEGLTISGYPSCAWDSDIYKMWLAQNQTSQGLGVITAGAKIVGGASAAIMTGGIGAAGGLGVAASGVNDIFNLISQSHDMDVMPPQAKGAFSTSVNITDNMHCFTLYFKSVTAERAMIIDNYFTMYGYKVNRVMVPNINARKAFTYVKTVGCHIQGDMCSEDIMKIESIFDKGITWWKDPSLMCDYTQDNKPI